MKFDIIIVGAGPGGYVAAVRAAQLGMKTAIVEREHLGGICLNWGCIPTKALLRSAEVFELMRNAKDYGLAADNVRIDADAIVQRSRAVSGRLSQGVSGLLKKNKVQTIWGEALLTAPGRLSVAESAVRSSRPRPDKPTGALGSGDYTADHIVIATGSRPRILPGLEPDGERIWTYFEAMTPKRMPERLLVIGSGAIGVEFASFYSGLGSKVTMVEALPQILPAEDGEIASFARAQFEKLGIAIRTGVTVKSANRVPDGRMVATVEGEGASEEIVADAIIVAVGVQGNVENLGLETLGVKLDRGCIAADGYGRTNVPGLYAIGDVAGPPMLAHKAEHEGVNCVEAICGILTHPIRKELIPGCTYSRPQIASLGLTEARAKAAGYEPRIGRFPFAANGKAIALGEDRGLVKTIFDATTGKLLGAHMAGAEVTELIQGFTIAMNLETTEDELIHTVFPHPTLSEMMHESVMDAYGRAVHK
jgi:dihydrolipoamide dehydrogenase